MTPVMHPSIQTKTPNVDLGFCLFGDKMAYVDEGAG